MSSSSLSSLISLPPLSLFPSFLIRAGGRWGEVGKGGRQQAMRWHGDTGEGATRRRRAGSGGRRDVKTTLGEMTRGTGGALRGSPALGDDDGLGASRCRTRWEAALACASRRSASISGCRCSATALTRPSAPPTSARRHRSGARRRPEAQQGRSSTATCDCSGDPERGKGAGSSTARHGWYDIICGVAIARHPGLVLVGSHVANVALDQSENYPLTRRSGHERERHQTPPPHMKDERAASGSICSTWVITNTQSSSGDPTASPSPSPRPRRGGVLGRRVVRPATVALGGS
uniref:Uncharacterized protein n=1 Tax=Oryza sativa subsp. japonica TaxID=39947 RepID=Q10M96_ORYSJ|nr:hypothetical protein LOC_Os03g20280 [Oryza sativa Japonica Group]